jgi:hypothetical protein
VDTGRAEDTRTIEDTGAVEEDENPKPASGPFGSDSPGATLQDGKPGKYLDAMQKARDALFVLDSIVGFVERKQDQPNRNSLYPSGESQQTRITLPSISMPRSASATESSSGLAELSLSPRNAPNHYRHPPNSANLQYAPPEKPRPALNFENIRMAAGHYGLPSPCHHSTPHAHTASSQVSHFYGTRRPQSIKDLSIPPHHNSMWMSVVTGISEGSRTANDKKRLRDRASEFVR